MRLIGSLAEEHAREELAGSNAALRAGQCVLSTVLRDHGVDPTTAFVFNSIPEQGEGIYEVLDGDRRVLNIDLLNGPGGGDPIVETASFADFRESIAKVSRSDKIRFAVALDLIARASRTST